MRVFMLPDVAQRVAEKRKHQPAAGENYGNRGGCEAKKTVMELIAFEYDADILFIPARKISLAKMMAEKGNESRN
mgnify:CR=1 FL=1